MPHIDPVVRFWISVAVTLAIGVSSGTVHLTNAIPADWITPATAWCGIIAFVGSTVLTALNAMASTTASRLASAASVDGVQRIVATPAIAAASPSDKVVASGSMK